MTNLHEHSLQRMPWQTAWRLKASVGGGVHAWISCEGALYACLYGFERAHTGTTVFSFVNCWKELLLAFRGPSFYAGADP